MCPSSMSSNSEQHTRFHTETFAQNNEEGGKFYYGVGVINYACNKVAST